MKKIILITLLFVLMTTIAYAAPYNFTNIQIEGSIYGPFRDIAVGDIDGDTDLDIVGMNNGGDIMWWENTGSDTFASEQYIALLSDSGTQKNQMFLEDIDNDGDLDIAGVSWSNDGATTVKIFRWTNNGDATVWTPISTIDSGIFVGSDIGTPYLYKPVRLADFNGDNLMDYVVSVTRAPTAASDTKIIYSTGTTVTRALGQWVYNTLQTGDVDGDGDEDILFTWAQWSAYPEQRIWYWYENLGGTSWSASPNVIEDMLQTDPDFDSAVGQNAIVLDWNLDGRNDIVAPHDWASYNKDGWWEKLVNGSWQFHNDIPLAGTSRSIAYSRNVVDMNGDGILDLVTHDPKIYEWGGTNETWGTVTDLISTVPGLAYPMGGMETIPADMNSDGDIDLIYNRWYPSNAIYYLRNEEATPWQPDTYNFTVGRIAAATDANQYVGMDLADIDGDGDLDIAAVAYATAGPVVWFEQQGLNQLNFTKHIISTATMGGVGSGAFIVDFDSDTDMDIVIAAGYSYSDEDMQPIDVNHDGTMDYVVSNSGTGPTYIYRFQNNGAETFTPLAGWTVSGDATRWVNGATGAITTISTAYAATSDGDNVGVGDVNGDGWDDVVIGDDKSGGAYQSNIVYFLNTGGAISGTPNVVFGPSGGIYRSAPIIGNVDGDTDNDIIHFGYDNVAWFENPGWSMFNIEPLGGSWYTQGDIYDITGDGQPELFATQYNGFQIWQHNETVPGDYSQPWYQTTIDDGPDFGAHSNIELGDVDQDGDLDVVLNDRGTIKSILLFVNEEIPTPAPPNQLPIITSLIVETDPITVGNPTNVIGNGTDNEDDLLYSAVDCDYPSTPTSFIASLTRTCTYNITGNYSIRWYLTDAAHPGNYSVFQDTSVEVLPNQLPTLDSVIYSDLTPAEYDIITITGSGTDPETDTLYYSIDCDYPSTPTAYDTTAGKNCQYNTTGVYTTRYYLTDNVHPTDRTVFFDQNLTVGPNQLPTINFISVETTTPFPNGQVKAQLGATDPEGNTMSYAFDCDYNAGDPTPAYSSTVFTRCSWPSIGTYVIRGYVTDEYHLTDYSNYIERTINVQELGTTYFFEDFGSGWGTYSMSGPVKTFPPVRSSAWLESQPIYTPTLGNGFENQWHYMATDGSRWVAQSADYLVNSVTGLLYGGYGLGGDYATVAYVFNDTIDFKEGDVIDLFCGKASNYGHFWMMFTDENGENGFCLSTTAYCSFDHSDVCDSSNVCINNFGCGNGLAGYPVASESNPINHVQFNPFASVPAANRDNIKNIELLIEHSGGAWSDPEALVIYLDDLSIEYTPSQYCGDGTCQTGAGESYLTCASDCPSVCGDGYCDVLQENNDLCPQDCSGTSGGGSTVVQVPKASSPTPLTCNPGVEYGGEIITDYQDIEIPYYLRELTSKQTCGIDADQDGIMCDLNEDFISCSQDCQFNMAEFLCVNTQKCMWTEQWFLQIIFIIQLMVAMYLIYLVMLT